MKRYSESININTLIAKFKHWVRSRKITSSDIDSTGATSGQVPTANGSGGVSWATPSEGMTNPMTTKGDIIVGGSSGTATRLAKGTEGKIFTAGATTPIWSYLPCYTSNPQTDPQIPNGQIAFCVVSSEPATRYNNVMYFYLIQGSNS